MAVTPEEHDCPSVPALALRLSWFHLLTSRDCPLSLSWLLCKAEETEPFLPSLQSLRVGRWALGGPRGFPPPLPAVPTASLGPAGVQEDTLGRPSKVVTPFPRRPQDLVCVLSCSAVASTHSVGWIPLHTDV